MAKQKTIGIPKVATVKRKAGKMARIAIIGFGNLLKASKGLSIGKWMPKGPKCKLEFSRVSKDGRLVLVVDEENGVENETFFSIAKTGDLEKAAKSFMKQQRIGSNRVGILDTRENLQSEAVSRHPETARNIFAWAKAQKVDCVIYNALGVCFKNRINVPFSVNNAGQYLAGLNGKTQRAAIDYIKSVPATIKTPFREAFNSTLTKSKSKTVAKMVKAK